jgi:hypothetical protein
MVIEETKEIGFWPEFFVETFYSHDVDENEATYAKNDKISKIASY